MNWVRGLCEMVGAGVLIWLALYALKEVVEMVIVSRIGWTRLGELGFWPAIWAVVKGQKL